MNWTTPAAQTATWLMAFMLSPEMWLALRRPLTGRATNVAPFARRAASPRRND
jgi:hypothetical protein